MFDCLQPAIDNDRFLSRVGCSGLQPKVIICIERLFNGGRYSEQSLLFHYLILKAKKYTQVTAKNRRPMQKKTTAWLVGI